MLNRIEIIGRAGQDPEVRTLDNDVKVATMSIATTETYTDKNGQKVEKTEWHNCVFWRGLAGVVEKYARKGGLYYCAGKLESRSYQDKEGVTRKAYEIKVEDFKMLGNAKEQGNAVEAHQAQRAAENGKQVTNPVTNTTTFTMEDADNDLPF